MIAGQFPFRSKDKRAILDMHLDALPVPPHEVRADKKTSPLEPIVMKLLEKDPKKRYQTALEAAQAIKEAMVTADSSLHDEEPYCWVADRKKTSQRAAETTERRAVA